MEESHPGLIDCEQNANGEMIDMRKGVFPFAKIPCDFYKILSRIHIESFYKIILPLKRKEFVPLEKVDEGKTTHTPEYDQVIIQIYVYKFRPLFYQCYFYKSRNTLY